MITQDTAQQRAVTKKDELGTAYIHEKPFSSGNPQALLTGAGKFNKIGRRIERPEQAINEGHARHAEPFFAFETPSMRGVTETIQRSATTDASVLIFGESGTGKSVAARSVHEKSRRFGRPLVTVSCPSLSRELLESTLFGHVRGSVAGAVCDHWGKVMEASGGTLFLDEIGDLPLEIQPKLLRLLQEGEYERVGETITRHAGVRVIASTNHDLKRRISEGTFREDLYYRLNVISVRMPALRERPDDLLLLAKFFLQHFAERYRNSAVAFGEEAAAAIQAYSWPGNLRELRNAIESAVIMSSGKLISLSSLPSDVRFNAAASESPNDSLSTCAGSLISIKRLEEIHIRRVLERTASMGHAAEVLGLDPATLFRKRKKFGIE